MPNQATFRVEDVFASGEKVVITGTLMSGCLQKGMGANINGKSAIAIQIEQSRKILDSASEVGSYIGITLDNVEKKDFSPGIITFE